ncbi:C-C motif chemokine ligand 20 isoform X1 [Takifugu rubripes]|uniref:C-C motif chemokine ligand 20 isoform X1 n=1 Tax=Takifugu rubripes TaxID=31033 RepID=UPI001145FD80|nr:C-C motif chemokine ligand 20 isoform X1 [Takifugu rubripes]
MTKHQSQLQHINTCRIEAARFGSSHRHSRRHDHRDNLRPLLRSGVDASSIRVSCCTRYSGKPVPPQLIRGYREHTAMENCRIEAIIFYTVQRKMVCANPKDEWVKKVLKLLSSKLRRLSKGKP